MITNLLTQLTAAQIPCLATLRAFFELLARLIVDICHEDGKNARFFVCCDEEERDAVVKNLKHLKVGDCIMIMCVPRFLIQNKKGAYRKNRTWIEVICRHKSGDTEARFAAMDKADKVLQKILNQAQRLTALIPVMSCMFGEKTFNEYAIPTKSNPTSEFSGYRLPFDLFTAYDCHIYIDDVKEEYQEEFVEWLEGQPYFCEE